MLSAGTRLGPYEIVGALGAGGMGEVYRARDTRLDRTVAIKILPQALAADPQFRDRFDREARAISQLDHPNICTLYDVGTEGGLSFLVMQYLDGETLEARVNRGALPIDQALAIAVQIANALDKAHRAGIVHRDLKPANVILVRSGGSSAAPIAKLLDFGLAKTLPGGAAAGASSMLPTTGPTLTAQGTILGTFQYMAPEQLEGRDADARTDIFAFGALVYEMATGRKAFEGKSPASLIAKILESEPPPLSTVQPMTPPALDRLVRKCLAKDPDERWQSAADLASELQWIARERVQPAGALASVGTPTGWRRTPPWIAIAALASTLAAIAGIGWWRAARPVDRPLIRMSAELSGATNEVFSAGRINGTLLSNARPGASLALSPDGSRLASTIQDADGRQRIAIRPLDQDDFTPLAGSDAGSGPFFSPDGRWVAFFSSGKLKKIPVDGGAPVTLCDAGNFASGSWSDDGSILAALTQDGPISRIPSAGGSPTAVTTLQPGEIAHAWPQVLPGGGAMLFTAYTGAGAEGAQIDALSFDTHKRTQVLRGGEEPRYVPSAAGGGYLVYLQGRTLFAARFDVSKLVVSGTPRPILTDVSTLHSSVDGEFDVSRNGTFVYFNGPEQNDRSIFWLDRTGRTEPLQAERGLYANLQFSPDGTRLAFVRGDVLGQADVWVQDLRRNTVERLTSLPGASDSPVWSRDGGHILFVNQRRATIDGTYWISSDGTGQPQRVSGPIGFPVSMSPDGTRVLFENGNPFSAMDVSIAALGGPPDHPRLDKAEPYVRAPGFPMPVFSPDGHWIAYASAETGTAQVYVRPFPGPGGKTAISVDGGTFPAWSSNGRELFFLDLDRRIRVVDYTTQHGEFSASEPRLWSERQILLAPGGGPFQPFALGPDGKRFAVMLYPDGSSQQARKLHLTFLLNFADELRRRLGD